MALRGLIGQGEPPLEDEIEDLRVVVLGDALEEEYFRELHQAKLNLFGSLEQDPRGNILAGSMTDVRFDMSSDFIEQRLPYIKWKKNDIPTKSPMSEAEQRDQFVQNYHRMMRGEPILATYVHVGKEKGG